MAYEERNIEELGDNEGNNDLVEGNGVQYDFSELTPNASTQRRKRKRIVKVDKGSYASYFFD